MSLLATALLIVVAAATLFVVARRCGLADVQSGIVAGTGAAFVAAAIVFARGLPPAAVTPGAAVAPLALHDRSGDVERPDKRLQRRGKAVLSLDSVTVNNTSTVVAGLKSARVFRVSAADKIAFNGWAFDPVGNMPADGVELRTNGKTVTAGYGGARPDVAAAYKSDRLVMVAFSAHVDGRMLRRGRNDASLIVLTSDGSGYYVMPTLIVLDREK